jgi:2-polyprenyl-3-methyl-5-hydroxy-6-metoxy-1,4-benzoquinol methylase
MTMSMSTQSRGQRRNGTFANSVSPLQIPTPLLPVRTPPDDPVTARNLHIWSAGEYDRIAAGFRDGAAAFVERLNLSPGTRVLDAACGSGNLTIPAARAGAEVTGLDIVPSLLGMTADWATREGLQVTLDEGTVERMPYAMGRFDVVLSMFGTMFAARPDQVVVELARVTRPGGRVALANWTRTGFIGKMLAHHVAAVPPPPGIPSVLLWGDEEVVRERFDEGMWRVATTRRTLTFRYPQPPEATADLFKSFYRPTIRTMEALDESGRVKLTEVLVDHWVSHQREDVPDETTAVDAEYLEVVAVRR